MSQSPGTPARSSASISAGSCPGSSRQSTSIVQEPGITFRLRDASIIVGESVAERSGATQLRRERVERARAVERCLDRRDLAEHDLEERLDLGDQRARRLEAAERVEHRRRPSAARCRRRAGRTRARSGPCSRSLNGAVAFSADRAEVVDAAAEDAALATALVDRRSPPAPRRDGPARARRRRSPRRPPRRP